MARRTKVTYQCWGTPGSPEVTLIPDPPDQTRKPKRGQQFLYALEAYDENCAMVWHYRKQRLGRYRIPQSAWPQELQVPKVGDEIYVPTQLYMSHGADDFNGGKAVVVDVYCDEVNGGLEAVIQIQERPGHGYYWKANLGRQGAQADFAKRYGETRAHADPDFRPEFNRWD